MKARNIPEIFLGALLAIAIFVMGLVFSFSIQLPFHPTQKAEPQSKSNESAAPIATNQVDQNERIADYTGALVLLTLVMAVGTVGLWLIAARTARRQLRAYITIHSGTIALEPLPNGHVRLFGQITFRNSGQTPAYKLRIRAAIDIADEGKDPFSATPFIDNENWAIVGPGAEHHIDRWRIVSAQDADAIQSGTKRAFLWGRVEYEDIFKKPRHYTFWQTNRNWYASNSRWSVGPYSHENAD